MCEGMAAAPTTTVTTASNREVDSLEDLLRNNLSGEALDEVNRILYGKSARFDIIDAILIMRQVIFRKLSFANLYQSAEQKNIQLDGYAFDAKIEQTRAPRKVCVYGKSYTFVSDSNRCNSKQDSRADNGAGDRTTRCDTSTCRRNDRRRGVRWCKHCLYARSMEYVIVDLKQQ